MASVPVRQDADDALRRRGAAQVHVEAAVEEGYIRLGKGGTKNLFQLIIYH